MSDGMCRNGMGGEGYDPSQQLLLPPHGCFEWAGEGCASPDSLHDLFSFEGDEINAGASGRQGWSPLKILEGREARRGETPRKLIRGGAQMDPSCGRLARFGASRPIISGCGAPSPSWRVAVRAGEIRGGGGGRAGGVGGDPKASPAGRRREASGWGLLLAASILMAVICPTLPSWVEGDEGDKILRSGAGGHMDGDSGGAEHRLGRSLGSWHAAGSSQAAGRGRARGRMREAVVKSAGEMREGVQKAWSVERGRRGRYKEGAELRLPRNYDPVLPPAKGEGSMGTLTPERGGMERTGWEEVVVEEVLMRGASGLERQKRRRGGGGGGGEGGGGLHGGSARIEWTGDARARRGEAHRDGAVATAGGGANHGMDSAASAGWRSLGGGVEEKGRRRYASVNSTEGFLCFGGASSVPTVAARESVMDPCGALERGQEWSGACEEPYFGGEAGCCFEESPGGGSGRCTSCGALGEAAADCSTAALACLDVMLETNGTVLLGEDWNARAGACVGGEEIGWYWSHPGKVMVGEWSQVGAVGSITAPGQCAPHCGWTPGCIAFAYDAAVKICLLYSGASGTRGLGSSRLLPCLRREISGVC